MYKIKKYVWVSFNGIETLSCLFSVTMIKQWATPSYLIPMLASYFQDGQGVFVQARDNCPLARGPPVHYPSQVMVGEVTTLLQRERNSTEKCIFNNKKCSNNRKRTGRAHWQTMHGGEC
jgi:hypothetical protein